MSLYTACASMPDSAQGASFGRYCALLRGLVNLGMKEDMRERLLHGAPRGVRRRWGQNVQDDDLWLGGDRQTAAVGVSVSISMGRGCCAGRCAGDFLQVNDHELDLEETATVGASPSPSDLVAMR